MSNSGFIIYNRDFFIDTCNRLRDSVCVSVCRHDFESVSDDLSDSPCEKCIFLALLNDLLFE